MRERNVIFIIIIIMTLIFVSACSHQTSLEQKTADSDIITINNKLFKGTNFENLEIPSNYNMKKFKGITLNFIVENNINANILSHESETFSRLTGINIKIRAMDYDTLIQKVNLDLLSQAGEYQIIYVDPYQTLNRFYTHLEILNPYINNFDTPNIKGFPEDFFSTKILVDSYFKEKENIYTIPFDSTTMILYYRKDIFNKYKDDFFEDKGYNWRPDSEDFTWEKYSEVARWIDNNIPDEEVKYGSGQMAQKHNSIFCEFSNILSAYGGDYFSDENINTLGLDNFSEINTLDSDFIQALDIYKEVVKASSPESINWNWTDTANAFRNGEIAMMVNWDENSTYIENEQSKVRGKVGYAILPSGDERSANIYGGSGIGINKYISKKEKEAAWLYIVWATSKNMQLKILKHPEGGSMPIRKSAYKSDNEIREYLNEPNAEEKKNISYKHIKAVLKAWEKENIYLRPKLKNFYQVEKILVSNLHEMVEKNIDSKIISGKIFKELNEIK
ncbi:MAG: extracellular solute-binding protein [Firmicutes bacterium]|nr:extracellular solute-binding protein [Bacillota bacterium]